MYLRKDVHAAFEQMHDAARKDGVQLKILSATRSFSGQKRIWEAKWTGRRKVDGKDLSKAIPFGVNRAKKILEYSSMPGTSRHHWGTDIDINALNNNYFESGRGKRVYQWLVKHAHEYGFYQPYTAKDNSRPEGYNEEKWHWSYLPVAKQLTYSYSGQITDDDLSGFKGFDTAIDIQIVNQYVMGINPDCK
jgi:LAS superfamily LD-carboxypeptidase LdcB